MRETLLSLTGGNHLHMLHCIKYEVCRIVSLPHTCVSPLCTLTLTLAQNGILPRRSNTFYFAAFHFFFFNSFVVILVGHEFKLSHYFTNIVSSSSSSSSCTYPLLNSLLFGHIISIS